MTDGLTADVLVFLLDGQTFENESPGIVHMAGLQQQVAQCVADPRNPEFLVAIFESLQGRVKESFRRQRVAAREVEMECAIAGRDQRHVRDARAVRRGGEDHAEADFVDQRFQ